jgi:hypothetical protein
MNNPEPDTFKAPPYAKRRLLVDVGGISQDVAPIQHVKCWQEAFPDGAVDWDEGWRELWRCAGGLIGTGTDFRFGDTRIEVEAFFSDESSSSIGIVLPFDLEEEAKWQRKVPDIVAQVFRSVEDQPVAGLIGAIVDEDADHSRPCLTMMVSGPGGSLEASLIFRYALAEYGVNTAVAIRTVGDEDAGVVKVPFLPEAYVASGHSSFGIDWKMWFQLAAQNPKAHWAAACLIWCDSVIAAVGKLQEQAPLMIENVYFDFLRTVPFMSQDDATFYLLGGPVAHLMRKEPYEFLF